jgi:ribulose-phosphate 3-epimerase
MAARRTLVSASILDADLADLENEARKALKAGSNRIHLDVMDGHFVPNITFGPGLIKRLRCIGKKPFDAHLMISEPGRYMDQFIDAGCDSITFHVEVEEPIEPTLLRFARPAGRLVWPSSPEPLSRPWSRTAISSTSSWS